VTRWSFLTNHGRALVCHRPGPRVRLRGNSDESGHFPSVVPTPIVTDLTEAGYVVKSKEGRRNRYEIQSHLPLPEFTGREQASAPSSTCWRRGGATAIHETLRRRGDAGVRPPRPHH